MSVAHACVTQSLALAALLSCLLTIACSGPDTSSIRAPEYEGPSTVAPTGTLKLVLDPVDSVLTRRSSVLVRYHLENIGDSAQHFRDIPEFYYFNLIDPDGDRQRPIANSSLLAVGRYDSVALQPEGRSPEHIINLACMDYHPTSFTPRFKNTDRRECMLEYRLRKHGRYKVIGQFIPPGPMPELDFPGRLPSVADTAEFEYWPWWQFWR